MITSHTPKEIAERLADDAENVVRRLLSNGKLVKAHGVSEWHAGDINNTKGQSLHVTLEGQHKGRWQDFANPDDKGDLLELWFKTMGCKNKGEAIRQAMEYLGIDRDMPWKYEPPKPKDKPRSVSGNVLPDNSRVRSYLRDVRGISNQTITEYKISEEPHFKHGYLQIVFPYWRENVHVMTKYRGLDDKKKMCTSANTQPCLFGWHRVSDYAKEITIVEGEIDVLSLREYGIDAVSVPFGGGSNKKQTQWIDFERQKLMGFDTIYLCLDNDDVGLEARLEIVKRLGKERCKIVILPKKDANDCLKAKIPKEQIDLAFKNSLNASDPHELRQLSSYINEAYQHRFEPTEKSLGYTTGFSNVEDALIFRPKELTVITGHPGHGKTQFFNQILVNMAKQGARICIASLEIPAIDTAENMAVQISGIPERSLTKEFHDAIYKWFHNKFWVFDQHGCTNLARLMKVFKFAATTYGIDVFMIDSLFMLGVSGDDLNGQSALIEELNAFKKEYDCHVFLVAHPRKKEDEVAPLSMSDLKGAYELAMGANNVICVRRTVEKELAMQKPQDKLTDKELEYLARADASMRFLKQRKVKRTEGGSKKSFHFKYHHECGQYTVGENSRARPLIEFSKL